MDTNADTVTGTDAVTGTDTDPGTDAVTRECQDVAALRTKK